MRVFEYKLLDTIQNSEATLAFDAFWTLAELASKRYNGVQ